jgi:hypothetical protein
MISPEVRLIKLYEDNNKILFYQYGNINDNAKYYIFKLSAILNYTEIFEYFINKNFYFREIEMFCCYVDNINILTLVYKYNTNIICIECFDKIKNII